MAPIKSVETKAPEGFVLNETPQIVTFAYADQETPVVKQTAVFENDRQKVEISVVKEMRKQKLRYYTQHSKMLIILKNAEK